MFMTGNELQVRTCPEVKISSRESSPLCVFVTYVGKSKTIRTFAITPF
jgi:hypothetical protein